MRKIPTLFHRDPEDRRYVTSEVTPGCEWVLAGEGTATRKYDGTCVLLDEDGNWWARREVKPGKQPPAGYRAVQTDPVTGKTVGWEPIAQSAFARFHAEAVAAGADRAPGSYELVGPKLNGNPERRTGHQLLRHATAEVLAPPARDHAALRAFVLALAAESGAEGVVFHHPDGRMAKLKARDFPPA
ncbi:hypothetical protein ACFYNO_37130 [Kitasatospora sp. NPDC006697]|uniref:hypothetical protein n=1 Tax=Kitasatospora sp. NPDC006697 TaxID=3364020 RepID=UPI0036A7D8F3